MYSKENKNQSGFSLIEILVVIAIVGLLASIGLSAFNMTRPKARDVKRKADAAQLMKAMSMYFYEYHAYPPLAGSNPGGVDDWLFTQSISGYMPLVPRDPSCASGSACNYQVQNNVEQTAYAIMIPFENIPDCKKLSEGADPNVFFPTVPVCTY